jgi:hypothetical protein
MDHPSLPAAKYLALKADTRRVGWNVRKVPMCDIASLADMEEATN